MRERRAGVANTTPNVVANGYMEYSKPVWGVSKSEDSGLMMAGASIRIVGEFTECAINNKDMSR
jgi:hypothetical protein